MQGGKTKSQRTLSADVRSLTLRKIKSVLEAEYTDEDKEDKKFQKDLILKLATGILPRLNEHTGEGGGDIKVSLINYTDKKEEKKEK